MNICLIDPNFLQPVHAGTTTYNFYLAKGLLKFGHKVHVICDDVPDIKTVKLPNLIIHRISTKGKASNKNSNTKSSDVLGIKTFLYLTYSLLARSWVYFLNYKRLNNSSHIDIVECADDLFAFWFAVFCAEKLIIRVHGPWTFMWKLNEKKFGITARVVYLLEKFQFKKIKYLTTPSNFMVDFVNNYYKTSKRIKVIKNPIDVHFIDRRIRSKQPYLLFLGRVEINKGVEQVLEISRKLSNKKFKFYIAGKKDDQFDQKIFGEITSTKNITYLGPTDYNVLLNKIAGAELILAPSKFENCSYAILESMALGKVVIASDIDGNRNLIKNLKNGFLCRSDYYRRISKVLDLPKAEKMLIEKQAKKKSKLFDIEAVIPDFISYYEGIIKNNKKFAIFTIDAETEEGIPEGVSYISRLRDKLELEYKIDIPLVWFVKYEENFDGYGLDVSLWKCLEERGDEIGWHYHAQHYCQRPDLTEKEKLSKYKTDLKKYFPEIKSKYPFRIKSFRAGWFLLPNFTLLDILNQIGIKIDSSVHLEEQGKEYSDTCPSKFKILYEKNINEPTMIKGVYEVPKISSNNSSDLLQFVFTHDWAVIDHCFDWSCPIPKSIKQDNLNLQQRLKWLIENGYEFVTLSEYFKIKK